MKWGPRRRVFVSDMLIFLMFYYHRSVVGCQLLCVDFDCGLCLSVRVIVRSCFRVSVVVASANCRFPGVAFRCLLLVSGCWVSVVDCCAAFRSVFQFSVPSSAIFAGKI